MKVEEWSIDKVKPYDNNPRNNDGAVDATANSIKEFGWQQPIVVDRGGVIIVGHTRLRAAKKLKLDKVPVVIAGSLSDEQVKAYRLADNKTGELADWDFNVLGAEMAEINDLDLADFGFDEPISDDDFDDDFSLPDGDKPNVGQITFTLSNEQIDLIKNTLSDVDQEGIETFGNTNKMGNSLFKVVKEWAERKM
ncbi:ParB N-terminal domain-containing protein [Lactiplantibacillus paraxiangfangensis]|uniref:ParB N-terminal domain-containing protein n=1 Tax=Lactiplantibacillus paraxiangfangensis TaxID=3076224 RepID=UPI0030C73E77